MQVRGWNEIDNHFVFIIFLFLIILHFLFASFKMKGVVKFKLNKINIIGKNQ